MSISVILITEDRLSEVVLKKMLTQTNRNYSIVNSLLWDKDTIRIKVNSINKSARGYTYLVLTDQDTPNRCPPDAIRELDEKVHPNLIYRFAVMEIESWVMAHRDAISKFLSVPINKIDDDTDSIDQPKEFLINLARKSRSSRIRRDIVPRDNSTSKMGPDYNGRLIEFVTEHWNVTTAAQHSQSLARAYTKLGNFTPVL